MKNSRVVFGVILAVPVVIWIQQAFSQEAPKPRLRCEARFEEMDKDKNGQVTLEEFMAEKHRRKRAEEAFKTKDANGDGILSKEEFCAGKGKKPAGGK